MIPAPIVAATVAFAALCIVGDVQTRRIPNLLSGFVHLVLLASYVFLIFAP